MTEVQHFNTQTTAFEGMHASWTEPDSTHIGFSIAEQTEINAQCAMTIDSGMGAAPRASAFITRPSRPRVSDKRTRPYAATSSRPNPHRKAETPCRYFMTGNCSAGATCRYRHIAVKPTQDSDLDQQLRVFVLGEDSDRAQGTIGSTVAPHERSLNSAPTAGADPDESDELTDEEELHEVIDHPSAAVSEVRFHSMACPSQLRTYFVARRQPVLEYEGNNVGVLSGGVLLGVPSACGTYMAKGASNAGEDDGPSSEITSSSPLSSVSGGDVELWQGPVKFDSFEPTESLVWADEEFFDSQMGDIESSAYDNALPAQPPIMPTPPPVIRRIIRQSDSHNRRHSLS